MDTRCTSVLIIEPHPLMREALRATVVLEPGLQLLEPSAMDPDAFPLVTSNQDDVLFLSSKPDLILLSLGNLGLGDLKTLTELRKTMPDAYILALTPDELPWQNQTALKHGAHAVIPKSVSREELLETLRSIHTYSRGITQAV
ncbi:hypothetical protein ANAEL_05329 [Anaerolineales bacterium]|nr:hypothetical protein ANAEL_05329 [Anaerolineales bacterium]